MEIGNADVKRRLAELAFGRANDCVQLVLDPEADAAGLDLSLLTEGYDADAKVKLHQCGSTVRLSVNGRGRRDLLIGR